MSYHILLNEDKRYPTDIIVLVADASNLRRNLLFCSRIIDLKRPVVIALTIVDVAARNDIKIDVAALERELEVLVVP